ncbi:Protein of unknown function [Cotesia congregata]|uniref:Uncharacterized protein n=1 Tax=Cotesia congregata TaxID=51543 RepID=A0A8J2HQA1_COTCN|nr:Protein of unknown function [Cotesia congregata]
MHYTSIYSHHLFRRRGGLKYISKTNHCPLVVNCQACRIRTCASSPTYQARWSLGSSGHFYAPASDDTGFQRGRLVSWETIRCVCTDSNSNSFSFVNDNSRTNQPIMTGLTAIDVFFCDFSKSTVSNRSITFRMAPTAIKSVKPFKKVIRSKVIRGLHTSTHTHTHTHTYIHTDTQTHRGNSQGSFLGPPNVEIR